MKRSTEWRFVCGFIDNIIALSGYQCQVWERRSNEPIVLFVLMKITNCYYIPLIYSIVAIIAGRWISLKKKNSLKIGARTRVRIVTYVSSVHTQQSIVVIFDIFRISFRSQWHPYRICYTLFSPLMSLLWLNAFDRSKRKKLEKNTGVL